MPNRRSNQTLWIIKLPALVTHPVAVTREVAPLASVKVPILVSITRFLKSARQLHADVFPAKLAGTDIHPVDLAYATVGHHWAALLVPSNTTDPFALS